MKICNNNGKKTTFEKLNSGDVFQREDCHHYFMKTKEVSDIGVTCVERFNAVDLNNGNMLYMGFGIDVIAVDCELIIH